MQPIALIRNALIFAGIAAGGFLAISATIRSNAPPPDETESTVASPIMLNTGRPPDLGSVPLSRPISLESSFGRSELTGEEVSRVPENPLEELTFNRSWDVSLVLSPPKPPTDLPPEKATDEVGEPEQEDTSLKKDLHLADLPNEAKRHAEAALADLQEGTRLLKTGLQESRKPGQEGREGREKMASAADFLRDARDKLTKALQLAPNHPELLRLMQEAKANLYICLKHTR
jgi:hypothetical protein